MSTCELFVKLSDRARTESNGLEAQSGCRVLCLDQTHSDNVLFLVVAANPLQRLGYCLGNDPESHCCLCFEICRKRSGTPVLDCKVQLWEYPSVGRCFLTLRPNDPLPRHPICDILPKGQDIQPTAIEILSHASNLSLMRRKAMPGSPKLDVLEWVAVLSCGTTNVCQVGP